MLEIRTVSENEDHGVGSRLYELLEERKKAGRKECLTGKHIMMQAVNLPEDFDALLDVINLFPIDDPALINIDVADVHKLFKLDYEKRICMEGRIQMMEIIAGEEDIPFMPEYLSHLRNADAACLNVEGDVTLMTANDFACMMKEVMEPEADIIFSATYNEQAGETVTFRALFHFTKEPEKWERG